jgi:hypothetical protein
MDRFSSKRYILFFCILILVPLFRVTKAQELIHGSVELTENCQDKAMIWLSHKTKSLGEELLLHTLVPNKGSFAFSVLPGQYQILASTAQGCDRIFEKIKISKGHNFKLNIRLEK